MMNRRQTTASTMMLLSIVAAVSLTVHSAHASTDPNLPAYTSFQQISLDLEQHTHDESPIPTTTPTTPLAPQSEDTATILPSVMSIYEGGCLVSSQAMMISGGDMFFGSSGFASSFSEADEDSDDDDDDDNDGHSSMLSNASLRRSRVAVGATMDANKRSKSADYKTATKALPAFGVLNSALAVRGGAAAADMGSELAKKLLVAAIVTLLYEGVIGHMLEFVKIVMQTAPDGTSYLDVLKLITKEKGIAGIWDGFVPWGVVQAIFKGGVFGLAHAIALNLLLPMADKGVLPKQLALTLAGGIGGGFQGYVLSPTLLLKTRVMTNPVFRESMSMWKTTLLSLTIGVDVVRNEGLSALMKGSHIFATKRVFDWATRFYFADVCEALMRAYKGGAALSSTDKIVSSFVGGTLSTLSTLPLDVLVAKSQDAKKAGVKVTALTLFQEELKEKGWGGLCSSYMRGFEARLLHVCFTTVAMKTGTALVYDAMYGGTKSA
jgi:Mitochondrial carrier protein